MAVLWPLSRIQALPIPETFATVPSSGAGS